MAAPQLTSTNAGAIKTLEKLSDQLDTAKEASEATTKEVQHARRTAETVKRVVRRRQPDDARRTRKGSKDGYTKDGKSKAAVELGRKGGAARAMTLTRKRRSALAMKAAKTRWSSR